MKIFGYSILRAIIAVWIACSIFQVLDGLGMAASGGPPGGLVQAAAFLAVGALLVAAWRRVTKQKAKLIETRRKTER
jgi:hypothetical protein